MEKFVALGSTVWSPRGHSLRLASTTHLTSVRLTLLGQVSMHTTSYSIFHIYRN